ncbi:MAG: DUF3576 domain-containing protein [Alphaproteobacteria bacterium]
MMRFILVFSAYLVLISCSSSNQANLEKFDKVYGRCDNPHRQFSDREYNICVAQERAGSLDKEPISITGIFNKKNENQSSSQGSFGSTINQSLWQSSLKVLTDYPLKNVDSVGGYIETEPVYDKENLSQRCTIKITILSSQLISNGIDTNIICEQKQQDLWINTNEDFSNEEKKLSLKILSEAQKLSNTNLN